MNQNKLKSQLTKILGEPLPDFTPVNHPTLAFVCKWEDDFKFIKLYAFKNGEIVATAGERVDDGEDYDIFPNLPIDDYVDLAHRYKQAVS